MPQVFQVLKCFKCSVFQVHQTKKSNKWECKLCGEKQSIKRHYSLGTGKECRLHVQKLNGIRGEIDELSEWDKLNVSHDEYEIKQEKIEMNKNVPKKESKWTNFIDREENVELPTNSNDKMFLGNAEVVLEVPKKKRKFNNPKVVIDQSSGNEGKMMKLIYNKQDASLNSSMLKNHSNNNSMSFTSINSNILDQKSPNTEASYEIKKQGLKSIISQEKPLKPNEYIPTKINKNSKWAQFTEHVENEEDTLPKEKEEKKGNSNNYNLFSLCDENELDNVLNF